MRAGQKSSGAARPRQQQLFSKVLFNESRAKEVFTELGRIWRDRIGFYAKLAAPQQKYTPVKLLDDPMRLAHWLFFLALPMRGGINSDDAFRFMQKLWEKCPELFDPSYVATVTEKDVIHALEKTATEFQATKGKQRAGTLSYKKEEHAHHWVQNAISLQKHWNGSVVEMYEGITNFEQGFACVKSKLKGIQRKIFCLFTMWLQEFRLIQEFPLPLVVDFHCLRVLTEQQILLVPTKQLGPGNPKKPERRRVRALWKYKAVRINNSLVNQVMWWSERFLFQYGLSSYDVSHGLWFLSRELCAGYYGNRSWTKKQNKKTGKFGLTTHLVNTEKLKHAFAWPSNYRDPCQFCPVEQTCKIAVPSGPYYDWGVLVDAGQHVIYPGRHLELDPSWTKKFPVIFKNSKTRDERPRDKIAPAKAKPVLVPIQLPLFRRRRKK